MTREHGHVAADRWLRLATRGALLLPLAVLAALLVDVAIDAGPRLTWDFLTSYPSRHAERAGILSPLIGSLLLTLGTIAFALPVGVGAAIYLEEYGAGGRLARVIEVNTATLAGVPSVVYGLLGLQVFVRWAALDRSVLAGSLTLGLLVLPLLITASREAIRAVPPTLREAALGLGVDRWTLVARVILPHAAPGIVTGGILAVSRAIGEAAPIILVGAVAYAAFVPFALNSPYTALPLQIFTWVSRPEKAFVHNAAAGIVVLLAVVLTLNLIAAAVRARVEERTGP